jgi:hypothetical protein
MWSKYVIFVYLFTYFKYVDCFAVHAYFRANFEYANTLRKHMHRGYIGACPPWEQIVNTDATGGPASCNALAGSINIMVLDTSVSQRKT